MKTFLEFISKEKLDDVEKFADRLFKKLNIDIVFTNHFLQRVNDKRNGKQINTAELISLFKKTFKNHGKKIARLPGNSEAVLNDLLSDLNLPFVVKFDLKNQEIDFVAKTIMRKKNFRTSSSKLTV